MEYFVLGVIAGNEVNNSACYVIFAIFGEEFGISDTLQHYSDTTLTLFFINYPNNNESSRGFGNC